MSHALNIFGLDHGPKKDSGSRDLPSLARGPGVEFGVPGRSWCGLPRQPFQINLDRVAVQMVFRWGIDKEGKTVPIDWLPPEFVSARRAQHLVSLGNAKYCGISGGNE